MEGKSNKNLNFEFVKDQIFFKEFIFILNKKKSFIFLFAFITSVIGAFYVNFKKPTWEGEFQIVLTEDNNSSFSNISNIKGSEIISKITGIDSTLSNIKTEVAILSSQSILRPIYKEFVNKSLKDQKKPYLSYKKWLKSLDINLQKGTNILDISYRDKEKDKVLVILNEISKAYQDYSKANKKKNIADTSIYLQEQIKIMEINSKKSLIKLQEFSVRNNIGSFDGLPNPNNLEPKLESIIDKSANSDLFKDGSFNKGIDGKIATQNRYKTQFQLLENLEAKLQQLSAFYKPESPRIKFLEQRIESLKNSLRRPKKILIEYRILYRQAIKDERLLDNLEDELSSLKLIKAREPDPWKLISIPSLIDEPVAPNKSILILFSLFAGLFLSSIFFIFRSYKSNIILNTYRLIDLLPFPLLKNFPVEYKSLWDNDIKLLKRNILKYDKNSVINILALGDLQSENFTLFKNLLCKDDANINIIQFNNLIKLEECNNAILTITQNDTKYDEILYIIESLKISKVKILGWIFIET